MQSIAWYVVAALAEIGGCFAFWVWLRQGKTCLWSILGMLSLVVFAVALTRIESGYAGRVYAAYGGIYILVSLLWLWVVEGVPPTAGT